MFMLFLLLSICLVQNADGFQIKASKLQTHLQNHINFNTQLIPRNHFNTYTPSSLFGNMQSWERCEAYAEMMKKPRWGGPLGAVLRYINIGIVATFFTIILRVINRLTVYGKKGLMKLVYHRPKGKGLLTVSNHMSVMDDPGLWSAMLPWYRIRPDQMRWSVCTDDVFFCLNGKMAPVFGGGNAVPLDRTGSLEQPLFKRFHEKLDSGSWCHIFAEGRVWQSWRFDRNQTNVGKFKFGVGKLVAHCKESPIVVPVYHRGMDQIVPEKRLTGKARIKRPSVPYTVVPKTGKKVFMHIGQPLDFTQELNDFNSKYPGMLDQWGSTAESLELYQSIANRIREAVVALEAVSFDRDPVTNETPLIADNCNSPTPPLLDENGAVTPVVTGATSGSGGSTGSGVPAVA